MVDIDVELGAFTAEFVEEEDDADKVVHKHDKGVQVVLLYYDTHQQQRLIGHAQVAQPPNALDEPRQVQGIFELEVLISEVQFLKHQKNETVQKGADVVGSAAVDDGSKQVQIVS